MKCARCNRLTLKPAIYINGNPIGRVCAKKMGISTVKRKPKNEIEGDEKTIDMFGYK